MKTTVLLLLGFTFTFIISCSKKDSTKTSDIKKITTQVNDTIQQKIDNTNNTNHTKIYDFQHFKGAINGKYAITLDINIKGNTVKGIMYYDKVGQYIDITGKLVNDSINMTGKSPNGKIYDNFIGKYYHNKIIGTWQNPQTHKSYPFMLKETDTGCVLSKFLSLSDSATWSNEIEDENGNPIQTSDCEVDYCCNCDYPVATPIKGFEKFILQTIWNYYPDSVNFEKFVKNYLFDTTEAPGDGVYAFIYSDTVIYNKNCIYSILYTKMTGSTAWNFTSEYVLYIYNFDLRKQSILRFDEVFTIDKQQFIDKVLNLKLNSDNELDTSDLQWGLTNKGMYFSTSNLMSSDFDTTISYSQLSPYLTENFKQRIKCCLR